jgi:(2S)-methylsuccinyl-CoA dehydrogenase
MTTACNGLPAELPSLQQFQGSLQAVRRYVDEVRAAVRRRVDKDGTADAALLDEAQWQVHGLGWLVAYERALRATCEWAAAAHDAGQFGRFEQLVITIGFAEYLSQIASGIAMSQDEIVRPAHFDCTAEAAALMDAPAVRRIVGCALASDLRKELMGEISARGAAHSRGYDGLDQTLGLIRDQFRRYAEENIVPHAQQWHRDNALVPAAVIADLSGMGAFGVTVAEEYGGLGLGAVAMCVITEELSRGYIGVGSLGTRSEIACELIRIGGTEAQREKYLPRIASGEILPAAVFTEPNNGSDLANLQTRARPEGDSYRINGGKTWITHAARADLMTLLVRTGAPDSGYKGLSMFLAEKPRGNEADPFPAEGMNGTEIEVLGYRGMREYEISFDGFKVPAEQVLGQQEGNGFKQLMTTFELARIQTAARALGVAQNAFELAAEYAAGRIQFRKALIEFPRVYCKLAWMAVEIAMVRQLTLAAARVKESGRRCDVEAGTAKLLAARVAWSAADNGLQIHGGNGYALEYPISRVLCDARILNVFEGAAEIQAQIVGRSQLLEGDVG